MAVRKTRDPIIATDPTGLFSEERIIVERHIRIAEVVPDPRGQESMLGAAFLAIGNYMAENDDAPGYDVSFEWGGRSFRAQLEPSERWVEAAQSHVEDEY